MANNIGWGQGTSNNNIGWGQGDINNLIFWGISQQLSYAGETDIVGGQAYFLDFLNDYQARIATDSGTFEAYSCLYNVFNSNLSKGGAFVYGLEGRANADGGITEADVCLIDFVNNLS